MIVDAKGYYAALSVSFDASAAEIKAAFRKLAKEYHPDSGVTQDGGARFRRISDAYEVLGNAGRRAAYDSASAAPEQSGSSARGVPPEPLRCRACGKITAQPRYIIFWRVISLVLVTSRTPIQGIFCSPCAQKESIKSSIFSGLLGWWGIPWGPIWTVVEGCKNALGGQHDPAKEEILLWHNALAFAANGNIALSYGLADRLSLASDSKIKADAAKLKEFFQSRGFEPTGKLSNAWKTNPGILAVRFAAVFAIPAALVYAIATDGSSPTAGSSGIPYADVASLPYSPPPNLASSSSEEEPAKQTPPPVSLCKHPPENGKILTGKANLNQNGHVLDIKNGSGGDAIIKLRKNGSGFVLSSFLVKNNNEAELHGIPDGDYRIQYAFGDALDEKCTAFSAINGAAEFPTVQHMETTEEPAFDGVYLERVRLTYTLYAVPAGNVHPSAIDQAAFDAP